MDEALWHRLAVALGIGLIVGLERGWNTREQPSGQRLAGLRTFAVTGLCGGVLAALSLPDRFVVLAAGALVVGALVVGGYLLTAREQRDFGMTTELAMLTTFGLGAVAVLGAPFEAGAAAIVMTLLLGFKTEFHAVVAKLDRQELLATLQLVAIVAVLVPLMPNRQLGPWDAVNPRVVAVLVLLIAGLSYVGYFAIRVLGARLGLGLTALFGGLSSSTAITVAYARRAHEEAPIRPLLAAGIALAAATMAPRVVVEVAAVNRALLAALWPTFAMLTLVPLAAAATLVRVEARGPQPAAVRLSNPLQLSAALWFGAVLIGLFVLSEGLRRTFGDAGAYAIAAIAGLLDVDAVSITMAEAAARRTLDAPTAERAIALAALVNTAVKAALAAIIGGRPMFKTASLILGLTVLAGTLTAIATLAR
jgi:uncharacterized membrane protein (DUF4010 family)